MHTIYHLESALEVNSDLIDSIKAAFKDKPITITVEEDSNLNELSDELKIILDQRLDDNKAVYITAEKSLDRLRNKNEI